MQPRIDAAIRFLTNGLPLWVRDPVTILPAVLISAFVVRAAWISLPPGALIFDESYYVNAARVILGWAIDPSAPYAGAAAGLDPNTEHPPLGKALIAASMMLFGDNGLGWRLPSVIAGMTVLGALYLIVRTAGESVPFGVLAVLLLGFENLTIVHSRMGTLDMLALAPVMVGAWLALRKRWAAAGVSLAIGALVKLTALFGLVAVLGLLTVQAWAHWRRDRRVARDDVRASLAVLLAFAIVAIGGLWLLDRQYTTFATPLDHARRMLEYGAGLTESPDGGGACTGISSAPWRWPFNECQINYLRVDVNGEGVDGLESSVVTVDVRGALNPLIAGAIPLSMLFASWRAWRANDRLARWALVWAAANYIPFVVLAIVSQRVMYLYYFLPVVPAITIAIALLLLRAGLPRLVLFGFLAAFAAGFVAYFPFRQVP